MDALASALFTASLALFGKIGFDLWGRHRDRRGVAGAIGGELAACLDILNRPDIWASYRALGQISRELRTQRLKAFPKLSATHPVFDKLADRIGSLPNSAAIEISRSYNVIASVKILITSMSDQNFLEADDETQVARLNYVAELLTLEIPRSLSLVNFLRVISNQSLLCWIFDCDLFTFN